MKLRLILGPLLWLAVCLSAQQPSPPPAHGHGEAAHTHPLPTNAIAMAREAGFQFVPFETLAGFDPGVKQTAAGPELGAKIPDEILALNGRRVAVVGFLTPRKLRDGKVTEFLLVRHLADGCQSGPAAVNEAVIVRLREPVSPPTVAAMQLAAGEFTVGEQREGGQLRAIYRLEAERIFAEPAGK